MHPPVPPNRSSMDEHSVEALVSTSGPGAPAGPVAPAGPTGP